MQDKKSAKWRGDLENTLGYEQFTWKKRIVAMADFITESDESVMDLGAGNMHLRGLLPVRLDYTPVDYKKNAPDTVVCDFNQHEFPDKQVDVIVAAGILGYIQDPLWFLDCICASCRKFVVSYKGNEEYETSLLSTKDIIEYMRGKGFTMTGRNLSLKDEWTLIACFEKITPELLCKQIECTGCGACSNICPKNAIEMKSNEDGFLSPYVNEDRCIACNKCVKTCPLLKSQDEGKRNPDMDIEVYAAWAEDEIRRDSSSGGAFYVLASAIIKRNGVVFGAKWDDKFNCVHDFVDEIEELPALMHSKYVQSNTVDSFQKVKYFLEEEKYVLYVGCPCQINGLKNYLGSDAGNPYLYTVDLVCFGAPSKKTFHKYMADNYDSDVISDVTFRDKNTGEGWSPTGYSITYKNGEKSYPKYEEDRYQQAFHSVLFRNDVCEKCEYYKVPRVGDFTFGDFWGIEKHNPTWNDGLGTSLLATNTCKAKSFLDEIKSQFKRLEKVPSDWCKDKGNRIITNARAGHPNRKYLSDLLKGDSIGFNQAVDDALKNKHDIGLTCMMNYNIGNNLTNYALYLYLKGLGYRVLMINMPESVPEMQLYKEKGPLFYFLKNPYQSYDLLQAKDKYDLLEHANICDMYVVGSDQLWRDKFVESTSYFTALDWVPSYKYKISYGTSMGTGEYVATESNMAQMGYLLKRFNAISVREQSAKDFLKSVWKVDSTVVLDPVFLCDRSYYDELASRGGLRTLRDKYIAAYLLDPTKEKEKFVKLLADEYTCGRYMAMTEPVYTEKDSQYIEYTLEPGIEEWVSMMKHSEIVITDSFHGLCFALIYEKPFYVIYEKDNWRGYDRFLYLLSELGLLDRLITDRYEIPDDYQQVLIDYGKVNLSLAKLKEYSKNWFVQALSKRNSYHGTHDVYDFYIKSQYDNMQNELHREKIDKNIRSKLFLQTLLMRKVTVEREHNVDNMMVVGWGAGNCFRYNLDHILEYCDMKFVCDSNSALWGTKLTDDIVCISPSELMKMNNVVVLIMVENAAVSISIANQLLDMGISNYDHVYNWLHAIEEE